MPYSQKGPHRIAYSVAGQGGPPVLLIIGLTMPGAAWRHQIDDLVGHHQLAWYDHAGLGESGPVRSRRLRMADMAADALGLLDELEWERAHVVGLSMGGMIAQHVALTAPHRVTSLSLLATHPGGRQAILPPASGLKQFLTVAGGPRKHRLDALSKMLFGPQFRERDPEQARDMLREDFGTPPPLRTSLAQLHAIARHRTVHRLEELAAIPTLIVQPGADILIDPRNSEVLHAGIRGSRLVRFDGAGHAVTRECAPELNPLLLEHFAGAQTQA